jgi:hypothetical protein
MFGVVKNIQRDLGDEGLCSVAGRLPRDLNVHGDRRH